MAESTAALRQVHTRHTALWLALASVVVWFAALLWISPQPIADERIHWHVITDLLQGRWPQPGRIPMFPAFHLVGAGLIAAVAGLGMSFDSPHPWNANPNYVHDRFLILLYMSAVVRYAVAALIVATVLLLADHVWSGPERYALLVVWGFSLLFLLPHWLADHRYYILPIMFIHFCTRYRPQQVRALCAWSLGWSVRAAGYVALYGGPCSGL